MSQTDYISYWIAVYFDQKFARQSIWLTYFGCAWCRFHTVSSNKYSCVDSVLLNALDSRYARLIYPMTWITLKPQQIGVVYR